MGEDGGRGEMQHPGLGRQGPEGEFREACITCPFQGSGAVPRFVPLTEKEVRRKNGSAARGKRVRKRLGWKYQAPAHSRSPLSVSTPGAVLAPLAVILPPDPVLFLALKYQNI